MMEISDWLEVLMPQKVVWNSVMVVCGALSVVIDGELQMPVWLVVSWDSLLKVVCLLAVQIIMLSIENIYIYIRILSFQELLLFSMPLLLVLACPLDLFSMMRQTV